MFQRGVSGNPAGRPRKNKSLTEILEKRLGKAGKDAIVQELIGLAKSGDLPSLKYVFDRLDGRPTVMKDIAVEVNQMDDVTSMTPEQRQHEIMRLLKNERDRMTPEQRRARAAFYLDGLAPEKSGT
jgi:hypothetical protein